MTSDKPNKSATSKALAPKISLYVDEMREKLKISQRSFAGSIGITKDSYRRRLRSVDGFTELELTKALKELNLEMEVKLKV